MALGYRRVTSPLQWGPPLTRVSSLFSLSFSFAPSQSLSVCSSIQRGLTQGCQGGDVPFRLVRSTYVSVAQAALTPTVAAMRLLCVLTRLVILPYREPEFQKVCPRWGRGAACLLSS